MLTYIAEHLAARYAEVAEGGREVHRLLLASNKILQVYIMYIYIYIFIYIYIYIYIYIHIYYICIYLYIRYIFIYISRNSWLRDMPR